MGGVNQSTAPPPAATAKIPSSVKVSASSVRFHEEQTLGEVHFHDDAAQLKCAVKSPVFFDAYSKWRDEGAADPLNVIGTDGAGGHASAHFHAFPDDNGKLQVAISVKKAEMGQTVLDLDKLVGYP